MRYNKRMHEVVIFIAKYFIILSVLGALLCWLKLNTGDKKRFIVATLAGAIVAIALAKVGSMVFNNPRPFIAGHFTPYFAHGNDNGFPSDHTLFTGLVAAVVWWYNKKLGGLLFAIALAVGLARVIAGVHHVVDIAGSLVFAIIGGAIGKYAADTVFPYRKKSRFAEKK